MALLHGAMGWSAVCDCGILDFPDHTHLQFVVSYKQKYVQEVVVNCLVKLAHEKSVVRRHDHSC